MTGADPIVFDVWTRAWALSRGVAPPQPWGSGVRIAVGLPDQRERFVFPRLIASEFAALARAISEPCVFLKVCASADAVAPLLPPRWELQRPGYMMRRTLAVAEVAMPDGFRVAIDARGAMLVAQVLDGGEVAAAGRIVPMGEWAVFDRIRTEEAYRRRGLGRALMAALSREAMARDAREGVLVATPEGRALYASIGWCEHAPYTTAVVPD